MMRYLTAFTILILFLYSCSNNSKKTTSTGKSAYLSNGVPDTIKVDPSANRDMMIILSILPDTLIKSIEWTRSQRGYMRESVEKHGYLIDSNAVFESVNTFKNTHIDLPLPKGSFLMTTYQIRDGHYVILTVETINEIQTVHAYELYKSTVIGLDLNVLLGKYALAFMADPSNQNCLGMLDSRNPIFNFTISESDEVKISINNYDEDNGKGCLKGNVLTLKFNKKQMPFDIESVAWKD
jgi:hypothetical protein